MRQIGELLSLAFAGGDLHPGSGSSASRIVSSVFGSHISEGDAYLQRDGC